MPLKAKPFGPEEWPEVIVKGTQVYNSNFWFPAYTLIIGLPGETEEDAWDTLRLIDRMERELPEKVGGRAHFTITPMNFVPVGVLKGEEFFDVTRMTEAQFCVIYRAWRHTLREIDRMPVSLLRLNPALRITFNLLFRLGARTILSYIRRVGSKLGYDSEKALLVRA